MNANDCLEFKDVGSFLDALANWKTFGGAVTYMIVSSRPIPRLHGASNILYFGESDNFGGNNSSRLWTYNYSRLPKYKNDYRIVEYATRLVNAGDTVSLRICTAPPNGQTVKQIQDALLRQYREEHWELPPLNSQCGD
jgi:hypothetical protein